MALIEFNDNIHKPFKVNMFNQESQERLIKNLAVIGYRAKLI